MASACRLEGLQALQSEELVLDAQEFLVCKLDAITLLVLVMFLLGLFDFV